MNEIQANLVTTLSVQNPNENPQTKEIGVYSNNIIGKLEGNQLPDGAVTDISFDESNKKLTIEKVDSTAVPAYKSSFDVNLGSDYIGTENNIVISGNTIDLAEIHDEGMSSTDGTVPQLTIDKYGRVTSFINKTLAAGGFKRVRYSPSDGPNAPSSDSAKSVISSITGQDGELIIYHNDKISSDLISSHVDTDGKYGKATINNYGHVKLTSPNTGNDIKNAEGQALGSDWGVLVTNLNTNLGTVETSLNTVTNTNSSNANKIWMTDASGKPGWGSNIVNNLTSESTIRALSAAQGKELKTLIDGKAAASHSHSYIPLSGSSNITGSLAPKTNGGPVLGSSTNKWGGIWTDAIELGGVNSGGYIDFHAKGTSSDYTTRIILGNSSDEYRLSIDRGIILGGAATGNVDFRIAGKTSGYTCRIGAASDGAVHIKNGVSGKGACIYLNSEGSGNPVSFSAANGKSTINCKVDDKGAAGLYCPSAGHWLIYDQGGTVYVTNSSDRREKNDLGKLSYEETINYLKNIEIHNFIYKNTEEKILQCGVFAQDVKKVLKDNDYNYRPFLIQESLENHDFIKDLNISNDEVKYSIDYTKFIPILWRGWQYNYEQNLELKKEIDELRKEINSRL